MLNHNNLGPISFIPVQKGSKMLRNQGLYFFSVITMWHKKKKNQYSTFLSAEQFDEDMETNRLTLPIQCISESCIKIKIHFNFHFHTSLSNLLRNHKSMKTKIEVNFLSLSGIGTGSVNQFGPIFPCNSIFCSKCYKILERVKTKGDFFTKWFDQYEKSQVFLQRIFLKYFSGNHCFLITFR